MHDVHSLHSKQTLKPFYFIVVLWGEQFRNYFTEYCLPSLLAPENIPVLQNTHKKNKFLICTLPEDWVALQKTPVFKALATFIEPIFIEIPPPKPGVSGCQHMGIGHKLATHLCYQDKVYGIAITPDLLFSNGTLKAVQQQAFLGKQIVYSAALRFTEEPIFTGLSDSGIYSPAANTEQFIKPLIASGRQLVKIGIPALHSQVLTYDFDAPYFVLHSPAAFFRVPGDGGILLHSLSWCPLLLDYGIVTEHNTESLETWTMDGDYVYKNFFHADQIHICTDSDEIMLVSWSPESYNPVSLKADFLRTYFKRLRYWINGVMIRATLEHPLYDQMKVNIFPIPVYWHTEDLNSIWTKLEENAQHIIVKWNRWDGKIFNFIYKRWRWVKQLFAYIVSYSGVIILALLGNEKARKQIFRRLKIITFQLKTIFGV